MLWMLHIVEWCSEVVDYSVRILSITAVLGSHDFWLCIWLGVQGGGEINIGREDFAGGIAVLPKLSVGLEIQLSDFEADNVILKGDYSQQAGEIVIGVFQLSLWFVLCIWLCLLAEYCCKAPSWQMCLNQ